MKTGRPALAYKRAYNAEKMNENAIRVEANRLINHPNVALRIEHYRQIALNRLNASVERIALEAARIAFFDARELFDDDGNPIPISELPEDVARVIVGLDVEDLFERDAEGKRTKVGIVRKYKLGPKMQALEMLARWRKMLEQSKPGDIDPARQELEAKTDEELEAEARAALELAVKQGYVKVLPTSSKAKAKG